MESPNPKVTAGVDLTHSPKRQKIEPRVYHYWIKDRHSFTFDEIEPYALACPNRDGYIVTPNKHVAQSSTLNFYWRLLRKPKLNHDNPVFIPDVSRTNGDTVCSICRKNFRKCNPFILNFNNRTYCLLDLGKMIVELKDSRSVRLEDYTIYPEQLNSIILYPNESLGAKPNQEKRTFESHKCPIEKFKPSTKFQSNPEFWKDVLIPNGGCWGMEAAAEKHKFIFPDNTAQIIIADQQCTGQKILWHHGKSFHHGSTVFRNCLFTNCEIFCDCWCACFFYGCRFVRCTFIWKPYWSKVEDRSSRCEVWGGQVINCKSDESNDEVVPKLKKLLGQEYFDLTEVVPMPTEETQRTRFKSALVSIFTSEPNEVDFLTRLKNTIESYDKPVVW